MDGSAEQAKGLLSAFDTLAADVSTVTALIAGLPPGGRAFDAATELADLLRDAADAASQLRSQQVHRIRQAEGLSLAQLARKIRVSKARAAQLVGSAATEETP